MQRLILKGLYAVATVNNPDIRPDLRYFVRDNYYCRLNQIRFVVPDFLTRNKYKVVHYHGEFQSELLHVLPFAYWHHLNGTLQQTVSCAGTKEFYFFSEDHREPYETRDWKAGYDYYEVPSMTHGSSFGSAKWARVPLKAHYRNKRFLFDKPLMVIANKYNMEWDNPPLNFLDIPLLDQIVSAYKDRYQIVYNRPQPTQIAEDNSEILDLYEHDWLREKHPEVLLMDDLYAQHRSTVTNFNHLQLMLYANCERFISVHGGTGALASYFGGINILLSNPDWGMEHTFNEFATIFPALSGAKILLAKTPGEILPYLETYYSNPYEHVD